MAGAGDGYSRSDDDQSVGVTRAGEPILASWTLLSWTQQMSLGGVIAYRPFARDDLDRLGGPMYPLLVLGEAPF